MASIYTDEERENRYSRLRKKKRIYDRIFDVCMWAAILFGAVAVGDAGGCVMEGLGAIRFTLIGIGIYGLIAIAGLILAIYKKDCRITALELVLLLTAGWMGAISDIGFSVLALIAVAALITDFLWQKLSKEEGFPLFEISYQERENQNKALQRYAENRAVAAGARIERTEPDNEMHDLLDADNDSTAVTQKLTGVHQRYQTSQTYETGRPQYTPGVMDDLESVAAADQDFNQPM